MRKRTQRASLLVAAAVSAAMLTGTAGVVAQDQVEIELYDLHTVNPGLSWIQRAADAYKGLNPNVTVKVTVNPGMKLPEVDVATAVTVCMLSPGSWLVAVSGDNTRLAGSTRAVGERISSAIAV